MKSIVSLSFWQERMKIAPDTFTQSHRAIALEDMATLSVDFPCGLGALTVRDSEFVGNVGVNGEILGGGIYNGQTLYLSCSWVVGNEAMDASGLSSTWGGGLYVRGMAGMGEWNRSPPYF